MGRKAGTLIGLEHIIGPPILCRQLEVRGNRVVRIGHVSKLRLRRAGARALYIARTIHLTCAGYGVLIALRNESRMRMTEIVLVGQRHRCGLGQTGGRVLVQPVSGPDIILARGRRSAAGGGRPEWCGAQTLEQVVRGAILLKDHDDVLKFGDLRGGGESSQPDREKAQSRGPAKPLNSVHTGSNPGRKSELRSGWPGWYQLAVRAVIQDLFLFWATEDRILRHFLTARVFY